MVQVQYFPCVCDQFKFNFSSFFFQHFYIFNISFYYRVQFFLYFVICLSHWRILYIHMPHYGKILNSIIYVQRMRGTKKYFFFFCFFMEEVLFTRYQYEVRAWMRYLTQHTTYCNGTWFFFLNCNILVL